MGKDCGEASLVEVAVTGESRLSLGDCGLCEGVEGRERVVAAGDSSEESVSDMVATQLSLLDVFLNVEVRTAESIRVRSSSVGGLLDIEYCLLEIEGPEYTRRDGCESDCAVALVSEHKGWVDSVPSLQRLSADCIGSRSSENEEVAYAQQLASV